MFTQAAKRLLTKVLATAVALSLFGQVHKMIKNSACMLVVRFPFTDWFIDLWQKIDRLIIHTALELEPRWRSLLHFYAIYGLKGYA